MSLEPDIQKTEGSEVERLSLPASWKLQLKAGTEGGYRLAQLDDYRGLSRSRLNWKPPLLLRLEARVSEQRLPGTWGFGFWNDPFSLGFGHEGAARRLPALPNALWFFHASEQNYLSLRDDLPARGMLAAAFSSATIPPALLALATPATVLLGVAATARWLRRATRHFVREDSCELLHDVTGWHEYRLEWLPGRARFAIDGVCRFETTMVPAAPLGFVLWIDNQYAAFPPSGRLSFGRLAQPSGAWLEVRGISIEPC